MKLLAGTCYDPASQASKATSSLLAMTAFDTTNLRLTFTVPSNGAVLVRLRTVVGSAASVPQLLLGLLDHSNSDVVKARQAVLMPGVTSNSSSLVQPIAATFVITGLTPGASLTYDAAYGVEIVIASSVIRYGGPNDTTAANAGGGFSYEIFDAPGLLAAAAYDPGTAATLAAATSSVMAVIDTTNLRVTFTAPSSGNVWVRLRGVVTAISAAQGSFLWGVLDGATVRLRLRGAGGRNILAGQSGATADDWVFEAGGLVTGLTPGTSYTWDAAYGVENPGTNAVIAMGGPDDTTTNNAWGQFAFDVWNVDDLPRAIGSVA